jgi:hypothetical protein
VTVEAKTDATVLALTGEPVDEPIVGYGPFVMNSHAEIQQAIEDVRVGRLGQIGLHKKRLPWMAAAEGYELLHDFEMRTRLSDDAVRTWHQRSEMLLTGDVRGGSTTKSSRSVS